MLEVFVVLTLIIVVLALLMPGVEAIRATARQTQCLSNARQIALASQNFQETHGHLPTMPLMSPDSPGWALDLLPFLEQRPLYQSFNLCGGVDDLTNLQAAAAGCPTVYRCTEISDDPVSLIATNGSTHRVRPVHYLLNSQILGRSFDEFSTTDSTILARDSGSSAHVWHSSPFGAPFDDGSDIVHFTGNVVCFLSGRAAIVAEKDMPDGHFSLSGSE
jgi:type II secretory pathway pseudopilin PulG